MVLRCYYWMSCKLFRDVQGILQKAVQLLGTILTSFSWRFLCKLPLECLEFALMHHLAPCSGSFHGRTSFESSASYKCKLQNSYHQKEMPMMSRRDGTSLGSFFACSNCSSKAACLALCPTPECHTPESGLAKFTIKKKKTWPRTALVPLFIAQST